MFTHFYHGTLEKISKAFGSLFNKIYVVRYDENGDEVDRILVPINYANRHAYIARLEAEPDLEDQVYVEAIFPRLSFEITALEYNSNRKLNTKHKQATDEAENGAKKTTYQSVPYDIAFSLTVIAKHVIDANQIVEQILPYFTPAYTVTIKSLAEMGFQEDIAIELLSVNPSDNYQEELSGAERQVRWDLQFLAKAHFYGPVEESKIIKKVQIDFLTPKSFDEETLTKTPRVARDTTVTAPPDAEPGDDFGYTETWEEFKDGKKYNPVTDTDDDIPA